MLSTKLTQFVAANTPQDISIDPLQVREVVASVTDLQILPSTLVLRKGEEMIARYGDPVVEGPNKGRATQALIGFPTHIVWSEPSFGDDGLKVVFKPFLSTGDASFLGQLKSPEGDILEGLGIFVLEISLPERMVRLPIPGWVGFEGYDGGGGYVDTTLCLESEVADILRPFTEELSKLLGQSGE